MGWKWKEEMITNVFFTIDLSLRNFKNASFSRLNVGNVGGVDIVVGWG